jgi:hypothetical protein
MVRLQVPLNYNWLEVYIDGEIVEAVQGKTEIPPMLRKRIEIELPGGTSEYNGKRYDKFDGSLTVMMPTSASIIAALQSNNTKRLSIQCAFQEDNIATGEIEDHTLVYDMDVTFFGTDRQSIASDSQGEIPIPYEAKSIKVSMDLVAIVDIDKRTGKDEVNSVDMSALMRVAYGQI